MKIERLSVGVTVHVARNAPSQRSANASSASPKESATRGRGVRAPIIATCLTSLCLAGCGFLKPSGITPRSFILTPLAVAGAPAEKAAIEVGVGPVTVPGYLFKNSIAVRRGTNEIAYLDTAVWAERLDLGLQRVLAADLAALLGTDRMHLSAWRPQDVNVEVFVNVERFDVDQNGEGVLVAWWRLLAPGGAKELKAGRFRQARSGPAPQADPRGATATMSELAADLSRELATAIKASVPR
jgi:uncharacterized lipoprotein YmbA